MGQDFKRILLATSFLVALGHEAAATDQIRMLPPTVLNSPTVCAGGNQLLAFSGTPSSDPSGASGINCVPVISDTVGNLGLAGAINLLNGGGGGQAILVGAKEALWSNGSLFSWGGGAASNYFSAPVGIGATVQNGNRLYAAGNTQATGSVQVGTNNNSCTAALAGAIRFNTSNKKFEGCNGSVWGSLSTSGFPASHSTITAYASGVGANSGCAAYTDANGKPWLATTDGWGNPQSWTDLHLIIGDVQLGNNQFHQTMTYCLVDTMGLTVATPYTKNFIPW